MTDKNTASIDLDKPGAHHLTPENIAATIKDLREIEDGTTSFLVENRDWRTQAGVLARIIEHLARRAEPSVAADERTMFEAWYRAGNPGAAPRGYSEDLSKNDEGQYFIYPVPRLWEAWQARAAIASPAVSQQAVWGPVETVADMVRNLLTLDQSTPIHAAFHVDIAGERRCRTRPVSISRERVIDGKWVDSRRKDVPYAIIVWAKQDEPVEDK